MSFVQYRFRPRLPDATQEGLGSIRVQFGLDGSRPPPPLRLCLFGYRIWVPSFNQNKHGPILQIYFQYQIPQKDLRMRLGIIQTHQMTSLGKIFVGLGGAGGDCCQRCFREYCTGFLLKCHLAIS